MDKILSACEDFLEWSTGRSEPILMDDIVYFRKYPKQYPVPYPDQKQTEYANVLDRGWDTVKKQSKEMGKYDYVFPGWSSSCLLDLKRVPDVFPFCWEFLESTTCSSGSSEIE